jgi:hypothetical protein
MKIAYGTVATALLEATAIGMVWSFAIATIKNTPRRKTVFA